jgi:hypothetical protein
MAAARRKMRRKASLHSPSPKVGAAGENGELSYALTLIDRVVSVIAYGC